MKPPRWNTRVLEILEERKPKSFVEVADAYGAVLASLIGNGGRLCWRPDSKPAPTAGHFRRACKPWCDQQFDRKEAATPPVRHDIIA